MTQSTADPQPPPTEAAINVRATMWDMITAYRISQIVRTAATLSLAEHCAADTVTAESIARAESTDAGTTARFLRACAAIGLLTCQEDCYFSGTPLLDILRRDAEGSQCGFAMSLPAPGHWRPWGDLPEAVRTGKSQAAQTLGGDLFDYYATHQDEGVAFFEGLSGMTAVAGSGSSPASSTPVTPGWLSMSAARLERSCTPLWRSTPHSTGLSTTCPPLPRRRRWLHGRLACTTG